MSFNIEGYSRNKHYLSQLLTEHDPQLVFLQELWIASCDCKQLGQDFPNLNFLVSTPDMFLHAEDMLCHQGPVWHGAAIAWNNDIHGKVTALESNYDRYSSIKIRLGSENLIAISLYAPTSGKDDEFLECLSYLTNFIDSNKSARDYLLIGMDANCSEKSTKRRKSALSSFCAKFNLRQHKSNKPTFHHNNQTSESSIDFFLISESERLKTGNILQLCTLENPLNMSSHDPLLCTTSVPLCIADNESTAKYSDTYIKFEQANIIWKETKLAQYQDLAGAVLTETLKFWNNPESIPHLCSLFPTLLVQCADMTLDSKPKRNNDLGFRKSKTIMKAERALKKAHNRWKMCGKPMSKLDQARKLYIEARSNLQRIIRCEENTKNLRTNVFLMNADIYDKKRVYARMKRARNEKSTKPNKLYTSAGEYSGDDILEGFAADSEFSSTARGKYEEFDNDFYELCRSDNSYIFEFKGEDQVKIPEMSRKDFTDIVYKEMKPGKACDAYKLTVEHIRECGEAAQECIRHLINMIINNIYYLTCPQIKVGLGSCIFKGKKKPVEQANSYRRVTVTPHIGAILDRYLNPIARDHLKAVQNSGQYGFTEGISYLMAAVERGECQRWALDNKMTCYGISLDGEAAFPSVEREILLSELNHIGEKGDFLRYSKNVYENTDCHIKLEGKLSRKFSEFTGTRQGHVRADTHYKTYINPCLNSVDRACIGFNIGPICVGATCCADDLYLSSDSPSSLQSLLNIVSHYAKRYRVSFNTSKTKAVITGSKHDMNYYKDLQIWSLNGEHVKVVENNDHLGLIVSGWQEEQKNIDKKISKCRASLFAMLGPAYAYRCKLSPVIQHHLWQTYNLPVLVSGLSALPIRPAHMSSLRLFHHKILRGILKLSPASPIPSLYFLLGELPLENKIDLEALTLFFSIWSNPATKLFEIVKYILKMADKNSLTWANHIRLVCLKYELPDPLHLLQYPAPSKASWKELIKTRVTVAAEQHWRREASNNSKMKYLNVNLLGLCGRPHPALLNIKTTRDTEKLRLHLKFLSGDFLTQQRIAKERKTSGPQCRICTAPEEDICHVLTTCRGTADVRERILPELLNTVAKANPCSGLLDLPELSMQTLTQFILDCGSPNLNNNIRLSYDHPITPEIFRISRDWCFSINNARTRLLKSLVQ